MRLRRRALISPAAAIGVALAGCGGAVTERDQWTVWVVTDAPVPQLVDRALVELLDERGELACGDCRRQLGVPSDPAAWPFSFGVAVPGNTGPVRVRVRLYRAARASSEGLPPPATSIDRTAALPPAVGNTDVSMVLDAECLGLAADPLARTTCGSGRLVGPEAVLELGKPDAAVRPGTWPRAATIACDGAPEGMVCVPGGFFILGDARSFATSSSKRSSHVLERFVSVSPFAIDRDELTVGVVRALVASGRVSAEPLVRAGGVSTFTQCTYLGRDDPTNDALPANCLPFTLAEQVCGALGKRLASEAEWEWVAGNLAEETTYPWGDAGEPCELATVGLGRYVFESSLSESDACRIRPGQPTRRAGVQAPGNPGDVTRLGVRQLAGGVSEWVADRLSGYDSACWHPEVPFIVDPRCDDPTAPLRTLRGGSWADAPASALSVNRQGFDPGSALPTIGTRCAISRGGTAP